MSEGETNVLPPIQFYVIMHDFCLIYMEIYQQEHKLATSEDSSSKIVGSFIDISSTLQATRNLIKSCASSCASKVSEKP